MELLSVVLFETEDKVLEDVFLKSELEELQLRNLRNLLKGVVRTNISHGRKEIIKQDDLFDLSCKAYLFFRGAHQDLRYRMFDLFEQAFVLLIVWNESSQVPGFVFQFVIFGRARADKIFCIDLRANIEFSTVLRCQ